MPRGTHQVELSIPIQQIWNFISVPSNWAPLVPGYFSHEEHTSKQSTWTLKGKLGKMEKTILIQIDITEWREPTEVSFLITGINEKLTGEGSFQAVPLPNTNTEMKSYLVLSSKGMKGPMINSALKTILTKKTKQLTEDIANQIKEMHRVRGMH